MAGDLSALRYVRFGSLDELVLQFEGGDEALTLRPGMTAEEVARALEDLAARIRSRKTA